MQLDNLSLAYLIKELKPLLEGAYVNKVSEVDSGTIKIKLHTKAGSKDLILSANSFFISPFSVTARHGKTNFAVSLKKELYNKKIVSLKQHEFDRVVSINFFEHTLVLEFIGKGNKILLAKDGKIISCARNEKWSDREIKKGLEYNFPKPPGINPISLKESFAKNSGETKTLKEIFKNSEKSVIKAIVSGVNISPLIAEETLFVLGVKKDSPATSLKETEVKKISEKISDFYSLKEKPAPVLYKEFPYYFPLSHLNKSNEPFEKMPSVNDYLAEQVLKTPALSKKIEKQTKSSENKVSKLEHQRKQQAIAKEKFLKGEFENKEKAEFIYQHYQELEELRKAILSASKKGLKAEEILKRIKSEAKKGNKSARLLRKIDLSRKKFEAEA